MHPIEIDAILKLAKTKLRSGRIPEAEAMYRQVLKEQPECAEAIHFLGLSAMQRGKLAEALEQVRRSIELAPDKAEYQNNLATVLGRMGRSPEALGAAQQAIDLEEPLAEAHNNKGVALEQLGRGDEAVEAYRRAVDLRADYADALSNLGTALSRKAEHDEAIKCLRRVAELRAKSPEAWKALGTGLRRAGRGAEAVTAYRMAVELNPRDADAHNNLGAALQEAGKIAEAERALRTCLSIDPNHKDAHWNLGLALLALGQWREGWIQYEWRRHLREDLGQKRDFPQPAWNGSPVEGRTVLLLCEQGLGDSIQFIRYAPLLARRGADVIVECQSKLRPLLAGVAGVKKVIARGEPLPEFDLHARLLTLPCIFGSTPDDLPNQVPYLSVEEERVERLREEFASAEGFKVGIVWQGSTAHKGDRFRSVPLEKFRALAEVEGVRLVSLQKGFGSEQIEKHRDELNLLEWSDPTDTTADALLETAAAMKCLDLVVTVDTSIAHLAGALAVPVWVMLPLANDWRWLTAREDSPWYPTMRLFRQKKPGDWDAVYARIQEALRGKVRATKVPTEEGCGAGAGI